MTSFLEHNADYLAFVFGLSLVSIAALCFALCGRDRRLPWLWLGLFTVTQGVVDWLALAPDAELDFPALRVLHPCLLIVTCLLFAEFGRQGWIAVRGRGPGRWALLPLLGLLGYLGWRGPEVLILTTGGFLIPLEGLLAAGIFWQSARQDRSGNGRWLVLMAASSAGLALGVLALLAPAALGLRPAPTPGMLPLLLVPLSGVSVFGLTGYWEGMWSRRSDLRYVRSRTRLAVGIGVSLIGLLGLGWLATDQLGHREDADSRDNLLIRTASVAAALPLGRVAALAQAADLTNNADYDFLRFQLERIRELNADCRYVYLMGRRGNQVVFLADAEPEDSADFSPFGQAYPEATVELRDLFSGGAPFVEGPTRDRWGIWISGLAPIASPETGRVEAVLGMDIDATTALGSVARARQLGIGIAAAMCALVIVIFLSFQRFADFTAQLGDSERRYHTLFDSTPNAIIQLDGEGRVLGVNRYGLETMGRSEAETTGQSFPDLFCLPDIKAQAREALAQVLAGGFAHFDGDAPRADGELVTWHVMLRPVLDEVRDVGRLVAICVDITERKHAEQVLSDTNRRLTAVNEIARALASTLDQESVMRIVLQEVARVVPCDRMSLVMCEPDGERGRIIGVQGIGASDPLLGQGDYIDLKAMGLEEVIAGGRQIYCPDLRQTKWPKQARLVQLGILSVVFLPIISDHLALGCLHVDRSEADAFSEEERTLLDSLTPHIAAALNNARTYEQLRAARAEQTHAVQRLTAVNEIARAVASTLDQESVMRIVVREVRRVMRGDGAALMTCDPGTYLGRIVGVEGEMATDPLAGPGAEVDFRKMGLVQAAREGRDLYIPDLALDSQPVAQRLIELGIHSSVAVPIVSDGLLTGCVSVARREVDAFSAEDRALLESLTPHIGAALKNARAYEQLRAARLELQKAQEQMVAVERLRSIGEVAGGVAHDFNNLLGVILSRTQLLLERLDDPEACASLRLIETATRDGRDTVKRIQHFVGKQSDEAMVVVNLDEVVAEALQLTGYRWKGEAEREGLTITTEALLGAAPMVRVNPAEIRQVLVNLIVNACDALPQGGRITVRTRSEGGRAWFEVADTGTGMDEETCAHAFDLFFTTKGADNTGLGLAVSQGIIQRHGGKIAVCSDVGRGTIFTVSLPLTSDEIEEETAMTSAPPPESLQVLVVDDDPLVLAAMQEALDAIGYPAVGAPNGLDAVNLVKQQPFDLVVTDLGMPGMSGWKVAEEVKHLSPHTQVVILTGWGDTIEPTRYVEETLSKPIELGVLREVMARAVARKAA